jgi:hypothetical protein
MRRPRINPKRDHQRRRPKVVNNFIRVAVGPAILYLTIGSNKPVKLLRDDVTKIEADTRKMIEELNESELESAMTSLGIQSLGLTDDEKKIIDLASRYVLAGYFILDN